MTVNNNAPQRTQAGDNFLQALEIEIKRRKRELESLQRTYTELTGANNNSAGERPTLADACEIILRKAGAPMHVDNLVPVLQSEYGLAVTEKNLTNTLNRWVSRGKRFRRQGPKTYTLRSTPEDRRSPKRAAVA